MSSFQYNQFLDENRSSPSRNRSDSHRFFESPITLSGETLADFFDNDHIKDGVSTRKLASMGGIFALAKALKVDLSTGLTTAGVDSADLAERVTRFGANRQIPPEEKTFWSFVVEAFEDTMLRVLIVSALVSLVIKMIEDYEHGWMDGFAIFMSVIIIVSVGSINNYVKEKQFEKLYASQEKTNVNVFRNRRMETVCVFDLLVGDLLQIQQGDIIPVDGILVKGNCVRMDEASITGESDLIDKINAHEIYQPSSSSIHLTPFIISDSKVMDGSGLLLVLTVGENTMMNKIKMRLSEEQPPTPLQVKLEDVANAVGKIGTGAATLTFFALLIHLGVECSTGDKEWLDIARFQEIVNFLLLAVTIIVVAVPEGLPLAVTLSLAYSVNKMKDENNFVRHLAACETMGGANNICSDKTGTLTQNIMSVTHLFVEEEEYHAKVFQPAKIQPSTFRLIAENICLNSEATPVWKEDGTLEQRGDRTECALIEFISKFGYDYRDFRPNNKIVRVIPFSSERKRMTTVFFDPAANKWLIFVKGAPEFIFDRCANIMKANRKVMPFNNFEKHDLNLKIINNFAEQSLRTLALAYKEYNVDPSTLSDEELEKGLTLLGIFGLQDPLRPEVQEAVAKCSDAGIVVRMVTGDNIVTACAIAKQCGILEPNFNLKQAYNDRGELQTYKVMEGKVFRQLVGGIVYERTSPDDKQGVGKVANFEKFKEIVRELKVLARSSSRDKYILVAGLIQMENVVAVTGDGTNDVEALKKADIGFAMGITGKKVTKWAADIILLDDNFKSIVTACKWGRNIYDSIRKFIQFQLTVNIVALFLAFIGSVVVKKSPLNAIQMLWVNLIMDSFASLALATEPPNDSLLNRPPHGRNEFIISPNMWRNIIGHSLYQIIVLCILLFLGPELLGIPPSFEMNDWNEAQGIHFTLVFNTFVWMQIFNEINMRKLRKSELNIFSGIFNNWIFIAIELLTVVVQILFIEKGGVFVQCSPLSLNYHFLSIGLGMGTFIVAFVIKLLPECLFNKIKLFRETKIYNLDGTFPSMLKKRASIRIGRSNSRSMVWMNSI